MPRAVDAPRREVAVVSYGIGNTGSVVNMLRRIGAHAVLAETPEAIARAQTLVLPGVGAFDAAMQALHESKLVPALREAVRGPSRLLGVCLGMQLLADRSDEGTLPGLGLIPGVVRRLDYEGDIEPPRLPHIGWSELTVIRDPALFSGLDEPRFYFAHSYRMVCADQADVVGTARYGPEFAAVVQRDNVVGFQFHPEKSGRNGMQLLRNFLQI